MRISPERGWIHDIRIQDDRSRTASFLERVQSLPDETSPDRPAWVEFEPEFNKSVPSLRMMRFLGYFMRKLQESTRSRRLRASRSDAAEPEGRTGNGMGR